MICYRLFYQSYLVFGVSKILSNVSDTSRFRESERSIVMSNTLYRCDNSSNLHKLFLCYILSCISINIARLVIIIISFSSAMELVLIWFVWCVSLTLVTCDTCVHVLGLGWTLMTRSIALTQIMKHYSSFLAKIDVTRGRSVPSPVENHRPVQVKR